MRYFDFHRRRLASKNHISGTPSTISGTESVMLNATSGSKISTLEIEGNTYQYQSESTVNKADPSYFSNSENYSSGGTAIYYISLPASLAEKEIAVSLNEKSSLTGIKIAVADDTSPLFASAYSAILNSDGTTATATGSSFKYLVITRTVITEDDYSLPSWWDSYDLQIELGYEVTQYVPFVAETPSPENPSAVKNSNDSGTLIKLQDINLLDTSKFPATQTINGVTFTNNGDGTITVDGTAGTESSCATFRLNSNEIFIQKSRQYLMIGCPSNGSTETYFLRDGWNSIKPDIGNGMISSSIGIKSAPMIQVFSGTTVSNLVFKPQLYDLTAIYGEGNEPTTVKEFLNDYPDYQPYFNKTVSIPSSVTLPDGTSLSINLAKVGDKADRLIVDRNQGKVIYERNVGYAKPTDVSKIHSYTYGEKNGVYFASAFEQITYCEDGFCSYEKIDTTVSKPFRKMLIGNNTAIIWIGILDRMGMTLDEFKEWFAEIQSGDNPFIVEYALSTPAEYDLTDTDFAKELLNLETSRGYDLTLEAEADIAPSTLSCEYYSLENEDKQTVTVRCEKADGTPLCEPYLHEVRKNTLYTVKAPEINGYVPDKASESADASLTTEIKFTYAEAEK